MINVLLSIKPAYAQLVIEGDKKFEFRKFFFSRPIDRIYLYATNPIGKIVASFKPGNVFKSEPEELWTKFGKYSGLDIDSYSAYFKGSKVGYAIQILDLNVLKPSIDPKLIFTSFVAPRSFKYFDGQLSKLSPSTPESRRMAVEPTRGIAALTDSPTDST